MFAKLLRHQWRSTRNVLGLLCAIILFSGVSIGLSARFLTGQVSAAPQWLGPVCLTVMLVCLFALAVCCAAGLLYLLFHYYQTRFTDQGYLTFTLPVSQHQLLLSGLTGMVLGDLLVLLAAGVAMVLALGILIIALPENLSQWQRLGEEFGSLWPVLRNALGKYGVDLLKLMGLAVLFWLSELVLLTLSVTVGAILSGKHPLLMTAGVYLGVSTLRSIIYSVFTVSSAVSGSAGGLLASVGLISLAIILVGYFLMYRLTSRKLNLT